MKNNIPNHIYEILRILEDNTSKPYLVGGCVRDTVMGTPPNDYDITVLASPESVTALFESKGYRTIDIGKKFGTVGVLSEGEIVEITPYRTESDYNDSRHPERVEFVSDIKLDLARRDFTINAMAMNKDGEILDIFGGKEDLNNKVIRCVGVPYERFSEDALRILRALRFASRFGFTIEEETKSAMIKCKELLHNISSERICEELRGILAGKDCYTVLTASPDVLSEIIPGFVPSEFLKQNTGDFALKLFSCIYNESFEAVLKICNYLKLSNADKDKILSLHKLYHTEVNKAFSDKIIFDEKTKRLLCDYPTEYIKDVFTFTKSDTDELCDFIKSGVYTASALALGGGEVAELELFPKNMTAKVLKKVLYSVAEGKTQNTRESIISFIKNLKI